MRPLALGAIALCLATLAANGAHAYTFVLTKGGVATHWNDLCVGVWVNESVSPGLDPAAAYGALESASSAWSTLGCSAVHVQTEGVTCFDEVGMSRWPGAQNTVLWRDDPGSWVHAERVVALTSLTYDTETGEIVDGDIEINAVDYEFATDGAIDRYDLRGTLTHEIGHLLGLDHSTDPTATMFADSHPGDLGKRALHDDDIEGICAIYPSESSHPSCDPPTPGYTFNAPFCPALPGHESCSGGPPGSAPWPVAALIVGLALWPLRRREAA